MLDIVSTADAMGKPTAADLKLGLATAPVLYACEQFPELEPLIARRFSGEGDVERARELVERSDGILRTQQLAATYCSEAVEQLHRLPASEPRSALMRLVELVLTRKA